MGKLEGKVCLITGGARGMGAAHAAALAAEGAKVVVCDVLDDEGAALAASVGGTYHHLDVTDEQQWQDVIEAVERDLGPLHALVNNAGVVTFAPIAQTDLAAWNRVVGINLTGTFLGIRAGAASMRKGGGGVIVNISSTAGLQGYGNIGSYVASKWGVRGLTKTAALELAPDAIRVVSVHPGAIRTPMTAGMREDDGYAGQPIPRIGEPDEVAKLVLFLIADATYSTGTEFVIDGGVTVGQVLRT